ncbi:MAG: hypothetical protein PUP92_01210 [Rhizonema sp. PD38]|nr:hypothetical protein [Rhizonema sp. PD38]
MTQPSRSRIKPSIDESRGWFRYRPALHVKLASVSTLSGRLYLTIDFEYKIQWEAFGGLAKLYLSINIVRMDERTGNMFFLAGECQRNIS